MVKLRDVISEILSEGSRTETRCLRSFQLIYWFCHGGSETKGFSSAAAIYGSAQFSRRSRGRRQSLPRSEAAILAVSDQTMREIFEESGSNDLFYRIIHTDNRILDRRGSASLHADLSRVSSYYETFIQIQSALNRNPSHNTVSELVRGRSLQTKLRQLYDRQAGFIFSCMSQDPSIINFFGEQASDSISSNQLLNGLRERVDSGRILNLLARAKASIAIIDPELAEELSVAWPRLEASELRLEPLSNEQLALVAGKPRRSAKETAAGKRQRPQP